MNYLFVLPDFKGFWPTGLAYVSAYLRASGFNVHCLNSTLHEEPIEELLNRAIVLNKIDVVCTGGMSIYSSEINAVLAAVKSIDPKILRVVGGPIVTSDPELSLSLVDFDVGVIGEGEETMVDMAKALESGGSLEKIHGLIIRKNKPPGFLKTMAREGINDLNTLPIPDYEAFGYGEYTRLILPNPYMPAFSLVDNLIVGEVVTSRSCPFSCTFCYHPLGKVYRARTIDHVFREIDYLVRNYNITFLNVMDELFSVKHSRMLEFAERIKPYGIHWAAQFRVPDADREVLKVLKESGMHTVGLGVESVSDRVLVSMKKKITRKQIEHAYAAAREVNVAPGGNLIFGDPEETDDTVEESLSWWKAHPETPLDLAMILAIPDAPIYRLALERKLITDKLKFVRDGFPVINLSKMSDKKFKEVQRLVIDSQVKKVLVGAFGTVVKSTSRSRQKMGRALVDFAMICPGCGTISQYLDYPHLGIGHGRVICKNLNCCRMVLLENKKVYSPLYSPAHVGVIGALKANLAYYVLRNINPLVKSHTFYKSMKRLVLRQPRRHSTVVAP